jgi:hypothetical protein
VGKTIFKLSKEEREDVKAGLDLMQEAMAKIKAERESPDYKGVFGGAFAAMGF